MPEETTNSTGAISVRPLFLTILCIITFIGSIAGIIINVKGYFNASTEVENITSGKSKMSLRNLTSEVRMEVVVRRVGDALSWEEKLTLCGEKA